jgi:FkbM family methyltransferase
MLTKLPKLILKRWLHSLGYEVRRTSAPETIGSDAFQDMRRLITIERPVVLDVGANIGQSIDLFREYFQNSIIHSFEPGKSAFAALREKYDKATGVYLVNSALGAVPESRTLIENIETDMSSILEPSSECWGEVVNRRTIDVLTVDEYCERSNISGIDILKSDTQGFDLEVLRGANGMLPTVTLIYIELIFGDMYKGLPRLDTVYSFLSEHGFSLVSFYKMHYRNGLLSWTDALFVNNSAVQRQKTPGFTEMQYNGPANTEPTRPTDSIGRRQLEFKATRAIRRIVIGTYRGRNE